jgi:gamma-glutamyltranspeptidase / glutathione hydrolase
VNKGMIAAPQPEAAEAGWEVLRAGGNAFDAAAVAGLVQCVVDPMNTSIGGSGCAVYHDGRSGDGGVASFMSRAGSRVRPDMWISRDQPIDMGYASACVPGNVRGFSDLLARYGSLSWREAIAPALALASDGFPVGRQLIREWHTDVRGRPDPYMRLTTLEAQRTFLRAGTAPYRAGEILKQPALARTLEILRDYGPDAFYGGEFARVAATDSECNGGWLTFDDFCAYRVRWDVPVTGEYRGYRYYGATPPASGAAVLHALRMLAGDDLAALGHNSPAYLHLLTEVVKAAFTIRRCYLGDGAPYADAITEESARAARQLISPDRAAPVPAATPAGGGTTHLSVTDKWGSAVAMTHSVGNPFGSGVVPPGTGVLFNGHMDSFSTKPGGPNEIQPRKARRTSISSSVLLREGRPALVVGASGSERIVTSTLQTILNVIDFGMTIPAAVSAPRMRWSKEILGLERRVPVQTVAVLAGLGHQVEHSVLGLDAGFGLCHAVGLSAANQGVDGACDPRAEGMALGVPG